MRIIWTNIFKDLNKYVILGSKLEEGFTPAGRFFLEKCVWNIWRFCPLWSCCLFVLDTGPQQTLDYESKLCHRICAGKECFLNSTIIIFLKYCRHIYLYSGNNCICVYVQSICFCVFPCLAAGQKNHLRQEVLFVQTDAFRGENVKEGCFERKAPTEEKPQLTKRKAPNKEKTQLTQEKHPPQRNHTHKEKPLAKRNCKCKTGKKKILLQASKIPYPTLP